MEHLLLSRNVMKENLLSEPTLSLCICVFVSSLDFVCPGFRMEGSEDRHRALLYHSETLRYHPDHKALTLINPQPFGLKFRV